jgi:hypothetical protein
MKTRPPAQERRGGNRPQRMDARRALSQSGQWQEPQRQWSERVCWPRCATILDVARSMGLLWPHQEMVKTATVQNIVRCGLTSFTSCCRVPVAGFVFILAH